MNYNTQYSFNCCEYSKNMYRISILEYKIKYNSNCILHTMNGKSMT